MLKSNRITRSAAVTFGAIALAAPAAQAVPYHTPAEWDAAANAPTAPPRVASVDDDFGWAAAATGAIVVTLVGAGAGLVRRRHNLTPAR